MPDDEDDPTTFDPDDAADAIVYSNRRNRIIRAQDSANPPAPLDVDPVAEHPNTSAAPSSTTTSAAPSSSSSPPSESSHRRESLAESVEPLMDQQRETTNDPPSTTESSPQRETDDGFTPVVRRRRRSYQPPDGFEVRRSTRTNKPVVRLIETMDTTSKTYDTNKPKGEHPVAFFAKNLHLLADFQTVDFSCAYYSQSELDGVYDPRADHLAHHLHQEMAHSNNIVNLAVCKAAVSDPDTLSYDEALRDDDVEKWKVAAQLEISQLEEKGTWIEVPVEDATERILPSTWVFRRKRTPLGIIKKHKGRFCVRGDLQEGEFNTFAPVVAWSTIRMILVFAITNNWILICVDFSNAFVQATLPEPVWVHLPRGYKSSMPGKTCLRLKKSLYGLSIAPRLWYEHLLKALLEDGFVKSVGDECLLLKKNMIVFLYVDDCGVCAPNTQLIDDLVERLNKKGFELTKEGSFSEYLGIKFHRDDATKTITMTQPGLTDKILAATGMELCNPNSTPAAQACLGSDVDGNKMKESWKYNSVVGMLLYLSTNTRPDITFAVSQVARFNANPKQSHATAVKTIVRYLAGIKDKGLIFTPTTKYKLDCYVDADFAGLHGREQQNDPASACSRTGYIMFFCGYPLVWKSKLQTETALSTFHAEYVALATAMRQIIVLQRVLKEIIECLNFGSKPTHTIFAETFKDNNSAYLLANTQHLSERSKALNVKWHFFWEHVRCKRNPTGTVLVSPIATDEQRADYLTKGLPAEKFEALRKLSQGW